MICPKCGSEMTDDSAFCTKCGASLHTNTQGAAGEQQNGAQWNSHSQQSGPQLNKEAYGYTNPQQNNGAYGYGNPQQNNGAYGYGNPQQNNGMPYGQPYVDPKDHSAEFQPKDISDNKVIAMLPYLLGILGTIIALLASKESDYVAFHVRQGLKILVVEVLLGLITVVLCWTVIVPVAAAVCTVILLVVRIISFVNVCNGQAKEPAIISSFGFLK